MEDNYYEKLKELEKKETPVVEAEVVNQEAPAAQSTNNTDQAKEFYEKMFGGQGPQNQEQMEEFNKAQYAQQIKFILKRRFTSLSFLFGFFGVISLYLGIVSLVTQMDEATIIEMLELIKWDVTAQNIDTMRLSFYIMYGTQIVLGIAFLFCAYNAKIGHNNALKYGKIVVIIALILSALSVDWLNLIVLTLIFMNIRSTKSFIDSNINNFN